MGRPGEAIGFAACVDVAGDGEGGEIDDGDVVVGAAGDEGAGSVGLHEDTGGAVTDADSL